MTDEKELKIKLVLKVDKDLYDRITKEAKAQGLPGTIEATLKTFCLDWFKGWEALIEEKDKQEDKSPLILPPSAMPN